MKCYDARWVVVVLALAGYAEIHAEALVLTDEDMDGIHAGGSRALTLASGADSTSAKLSTTTDGGASATAYSQGETTVVLTDAQANDRFASARSLSSASSAYRLGAPLF